MYRRKRIRGLWESRGKPLPGLVFILNRLPEFACYTRASPDEPTMRAAAATAPVAQAQSTGNSWTTEPCVLELTSIVALTGIIFVAFIGLFQNYLAKIDDFADSASYMQIAAAIQHWDFRGLAIGHFWGLPYLMALLSKITGASERASLLIISVGSSLASVILARRLWGGWIAGLFAVLSLDWIQRSFLGGSEPLFVALLFASFLAVRRDHCLLAALLAALATVCRPLGVFALLAIGAMLLWQRKYLKCATATVIGAVIGLAYAWPIGHYFGSPLANVHGYDPKGNIFGIPFYAIIQGTMLYPASWTNLILSFGWILFITLGAIAMIAREEYRAYARRFPVESIFATLYMISIYCYNYPSWARGSFARFMIPALPFVLVALMRWIPKDRRLLWACAIIMPVLAAASAIGVQHVVLAIRRIL